jgi:hypothetical protein
MYNIRLSTLRMYTCAALKGLVESTVPVKLTMPCSGAAFGRLCAVARPLTADTKYPATRPVTAITSISTCLCIDRRWDDRNSFKVLILYSTRLMSEVDRTDQTRRNLPAR